MWSIHFIAAVVLLLLVMQWSNARNLNVASGIANRQLTIEESRGSSVQTTSSSNDANNCTICLDHAGRNESASPNYPSSNGSFPCGHGKNIHQTCFEKYLRNLTGRLNVVQCSYCRGSLHLTDTQKALIGTHGENKRETGPITEDELAAIVERWPRIKEIGRLNIDCHETYSLLRCAYMVLYEAIEDVVSPTMNSYLEDPINFFRSALSRFGENMPTLFKFTNFRVYNDADGSLITIGEACQRSFHSLNGANYARDMRRMMAQLPRLSREDKQQKLALFPELVNFKLKDIMEDGNSIGNIYDAVTLLLLPSLNTEILAEKLQQLNDEFVLINLRVDRVLKMEYPNLVQYKKIGSVHDPYDTIENKARLGLHTAFEYLGTLHNLSRLNDGAKIIEHSVDKFILKKYGHCRILGFMEDVPGRDITFYIAIKYMLNPHLGFLEKQRWEMEILSQLKLQHCTPRDAAPLPSSKSILPRISYTAARIKHRMKGLLIERPN